MASDWKLSESARLLTLLLNFNGKCTMRFWEDSGRLVIYIYHDGGSSSIEPFGLETTHITEWVLSTLFLSFCSVFGWDSADSRLRRGWYCGWLLGYNKKNQNLSKNEGESGQRTLFPFPFCKFDGGFFLSSLDFLMTLIHFALLCCFSLGLTVRLNRERQKRRV